MRFGSILIYGIVSALLLSCAQQASAHRDDYLNETIVYLTLAQSEIEAEYWFDLGRYSETDKNFTRHNIASEWGITDKWMVDGRVTLLSNQNKTMEFSSGRLESRYRFGDEGTYPVDIALSAEVNSERESDGSTTQGIEPRLILSKDIGEKLNLTSNISEEVPFDAESSAFLLAFGTRYNLTDLVRAGSEVQYNFGSHSGLVIPQLWFTFTRDLTVKVGYSAAFDQGSDSFARAALEMEF